MGIFSAKGKKDVFLSLDIGTEVVKALVCRIDRDAGRAEVIGVGRTAQKAGNMQSGAVSDISGVIESSREAIALAKKNAGLRDVRKSIIGIAGELVKGTTTTVHYDRVNRNIRIGMPELRMIIEKVQEKAFERIRRQLAWETGQSDIEVKLINAALVDVRIDGYRKTNPLNFQGGDVSMSVFNAYAPMVHLGALETIAGELGLDLLSVAAEPYAVARAVEVEDMMDFSAIFIDVGGGTTDIAVVRNGGLEGTKMFALGGRAFTKRLAQVYGIPFDVAERLKIDFSLGKLDPQRTAEISQVFEEDCRVWLGGVELSLSEFAETDLLPHRIFLCGGGSGLPGIRSALLSDRWSNDLPFGSGIEVGFLQPKDIVRVVDTTEQLGNPQDVPPLSLANLVLLEELEGERMLADLLRKSMESIDRK
ncbi:MAG: pilus assembly protein PilM [Candidatus Moranbacteria bacterium]|nr:pilus assembly protein PilM [Candidatus Moranbacteria bacterium]NTW45449.1 pilus assembly protein PilM [Candidatus Moranbacteria bacterium]